jgi:hypothetical protein
MNIMTYEHCSEHPKLQYNLAAPDTFTDLFVHIGSGELPRPETQSGLKISSLRRSPLGRLRCTVAVPCEDRARAVEETGPAGRHGATQEPHSTPAQDT